MAEEQKTEEKKTTEEKKKRVVIRDITDEASAAKQKELRFSKRFHVRWDTGDEVEGVKEGDIVIKRPTIGDQARIGVLMAEMREDRPPSSLDMTTFTLHQWIAYCKVVVTQAPPWFVPEEMFDPEPLRDVYEVALTYFQSFRKAGVE